MSWEIPANSLVEHFSLLTAITYPWQNKSLCKWENSNPYTTATKTHPNNLDWGNPDKAQSNCWCHCEHPYKEKTELRHYFSKDWPERYQFFKAVFTKDQFYKSLEYFMWVLWALPLLKQDETKFTMRWIIYRKNSRCTVSKNEFQLLQPTETQ